MDEKNLIQQVEDDEFTSFLDYLRKIKGYSENTAQGYGFDVASFLLFLKSQNVSKDKVNRELIHVYMLDETYQGISKSSMNRRIAALRHFYKYLYTYKGYKDNPFEGIHSPKKEKRLPQFLSFKEMSELLDSNLKREDVLAERDQALLELLFASGLRAGEVIILKLTDLDFDQRVMRIFGKGKKERIVPFSKTAKNALLNYIHGLRLLLLKDAKEDEGFVFLNSQGKKLTERGLEYIVSKAAEKCGFPLKVHPHMFRHSFATELLNNDADLRVIQEILGHESISTTSIYTHVTYQDLKRTHDRCFNTGISLKDGGKMKDKKYVIFDFNGTMFKDDIKHVISWRAYAKEKFHVEIKDEDFDAHIHGFNNKEILEYLSGKTLTMSEVKKLAKEKELVYQKLCEQDKDSFHLTDGLPAFLDLLVKNDIEIAIATASMKPNVDWYIKSFSLLKWFRREHIIYDDGTIKNGKPDPEIYNKTLDILHADKARTLVFEDSMSGLTAALRSQVAKVVAIEDEENVLKAKNIQGISCILNDFTQIPNEIMDFLLK